MADDVKTIQLGDEEYRLPYESVLDQNVDDDSLATSIEKEGMIYPIVYRETEEGREIIDGNTRARLIAEERIPPSYLRLEPVEIDDEDHAYDLAIQLNFQRRQIGPAQRRKTIQKIMDKKPWRKANAHVTDLAELLGVSPATISNDIKKIWGTDEDDKLRDERRRINHLLTGMRYLSEGDVDLPDLSDKFEEDELTIGENYLKALQERLEDRRSEITKTLKSAEKDSK